MPGAGMVGGPRHYEGPTLGTVSVWRCPSCGVENSSVFEDGCPACGAGSAKPRHVGVPPTTKQAIAQVSDVDQAFGVWLAPKRGIYSPEIEALLFNAWRAAIEWYRSTVPVVTTPVTPDEETPETITLPKELLLRVLVTLEATTDLPDGQQSPELLALISELKERLE